MAWFGCLIPVFHCHPMRKLFLSLLALFPVSSAVEPWVDPRLTETNGLALWVDVSRQNAGRGTLGLTPLRSWSDAPDVLLDGSGRKAHLQQSFHPARPRFRQEFNGAMLSFDGTNDFLAGTTLDHTWAEASIFVVAAPRTNGAYRALMSLSQPGLNDYTTGVNLDFGSAPSPQLSRINAEGAGFSGESNLLAESTPLGKWHIFALVLKNGADGVKLHVDSKSQKSRHRDSAGIHSGEITLGARRFSNSADRPHAQGFFHGDFTEMLVFNRALNEGERAGVERYLDEKYGALLRGLEGATVREGAIPLVAATNPPPFQMHFPGFEARPLPLEIGNVNNVRYRADGKLVAMGYDGRVWLLHDSDGDGLEDKAELFWDKETIRAPIGIALTPAGYKRGQGLFIAGKEKVSLVVDTNGDDRADEEITVATWTERSEQQGVDALGIVVAPDGRIYFSLGAASFVEPLLIDRATGKSRYRTTMERGTIQRVSADFSKRETVCTGIRFAVGLDFNKHGDLFCTDQEGATWVHNGNPFDELLHIQPGRHYGFPPKHPRHLPDVIDEPSVFDYTPQHQSTCGLQFNRQGNAFFGPASWADDAIVSGYSRGKLWKTKLVKTGNGYVAQTHLLATMGSLTVDACVSPAGALVVASHSGQPDWGSGPKGIGYLWKIRSTEVPVPVLAWNNSPTELRVAFDRPLDPATLRDLNHAARIESGQYVFPGDRFETIRPGYQVVYDQLSAARFSHEILSTQLSPDRKTLSFLTRARHSAANYVVTMPDHSRPEHSDTDLLTDFTGVLATVSGEGSEPMEIWLPHLDSNVAQELTAGSEEHAGFAKRLREPGTLTVRGQLNLAHMLQPTVQPGSNIDWQHPPEKVTVTFTGSAPIEGRFRGESIQRSAASGNRHALTTEFDGPGKTWQQFEIKIATGPGHKLSAHWFTAEDPRPRAFPLRRMLVPWARPLETGTPVPAGERVIPEIAGGDWQRGRDLYFSARLACATCHKVHGGGGEVGPDLSNLSHRDYASVRKDVQFPNAALNPDHLASVVELADGEMAAGILKSEKDGVIQLALADGTLQKIPRSEVKEVRPAQLSLMPEKIWDNLNTDEQRDLMTFLLTAPPTKK